jgi:hypothetical protein
MGIGQVSYCEGYMHIDGMQPEYVILTDPEPEKSPIWVRELNVPSELSKIMIDHTHQPAVVMDVAAFELWRSQQTHEEAVAQIKDMWQAVRHFDAAAIQHLPFLLTAETLVIMIREGQFDLKYSFHMPDVT